MPTPDRPLRAAFWMIGSILAFSAMAIAGRQIGGIHDSFEIMTVRSAVGLGLVLLTGLGLFELCRRQFLKQWSQIQEEIEHQIKRGEAL